MLKKSLSILCALSIITVLCLAVGCVKNNPPAITEDISSSDITVQSENGESNNTKRKPRNHDFICARHDKES